MYPLGESINPLSALLLIKKEPLSGNLIPKKTLLKRIVSYYYPIIYVLVERRLPPGKRMRNSS
jgi:hypothetical protein